MGGGSKSRKKYTIAITTVAILAIVYLLWSSGGKFSAETGRGEEAQARDSGSAAKIDKLTIVINPIPRDRVEREAKELEEFLESRLGVDVELYFPLNVAAIVEALRFGHAQVALGVGTLPASLALSLADVELLLVEVREVILSDRLTEAPYYYSHWIVLKDSPYGKLTELKGKRVCFPSELSTSGYIFPMYRMVQLGYLKPPVDPKQFFGEVVFGGGYAQCWEALKKGHVDVTIMAGDVPAKLYWEAMNGSRVLESQGPIPSHVVLVSKKIPREFRDKIKSALLELNDRRDLMRKFVSGIFVRFEEKTAEEHLGLLMKALEETGLREKYLK